MSNEEYPVEGTCVECRKEVKAAEKGILLLRHYIAVHCIHRGKCSRGYKKKWLTGREAIKRGYILGICCYCGKPVRDKELYVAERLLRIGPGDGGYSEYLGSTTIPPGDEVVFQHKECLDKWRESPI